MFNLDETGFPLCGNNTLKIITDRGSKNVYNVDSENRLQRWVALLQQEFLKTLVLLPGVRPIFKFHNVDPKDFDMVHTPNCWIDSDSFFSGFSNHSTNRFERKCNFLL